MWQLCIQVFQLAMILLCSFSINKIISLCCCLLFHNVLKTFADWIFYYIGMRCVVFITHSLHKCFIKARENTWNELIFDFRFIFEHSTNHFSHSTGVPIDGMQSISCSRNITLQNLPDKLCVKCHEIIFKQSVSENNAPSNNSVDFSKNNIWYHNDENSSQIYLLFVLFG